MKPPTIALAIFAVATAGVAIRLAWENRQLRWELARRAVLPAEVPQDAKAPPLMAAKPKPPVTATPLADAPAASLEAERRAHAAGRIRWSRPEERAARFDAAVLGVARRYGRLFQQLGLAPDQRDALARQLAENEMAMADAALPDSLPLDESRITALAATLRQVEADNRRRLRALLGDEGYARLDAFEKTEPYRDTVEPLANAMRAGGIAVDPAAEDALVRAYATAFQRATERAAAASPADPAQLTDEQRQTLKRSQLEALHLELMHQLSAVLTPAQLNAFMQAQLESESLP